MLTSYRRVLTRELRHLFVASIIGRLPIGMSGSFATGGAATGCYVARLACVAPAIGHAIDRRGPRTMLLACAVLFPSALCALLAAVAAGAPGVAVLSCATVADASFPTITVCMRTYLRQRMADETALVTAYSLDSVLIETMFIIGPLLVAVFVALASPRAAVASLRAAASSACFCFCAQRWLRNWKIEPRGHATLLGPLAERSFVALIAVVLCYALAFGLTEIGSQPTLRKRSSLPWRAYSLV